jgi:hypothetical protein
MDDLDRAQVATDEMLSDILKMRKPSGPVETGYCLTCGEPLPAGRRWCDALCRDEWEGK